MAALDLLLFVACQICHALKECIYVSICQSIPAQDLSACAQRHVSELESCLYSGLPFFGRIASTLVTYSQGFS